MAIIVPDIRSHERTNARDSAARIEEAQGLAMAIGVTIVATFPLTVRKASSATLLGKGQVDALAGQLAALDVELVYVDATLTPIQQRNLETMWNIKVIDRTGLILEIFGERAATAEGKMQVELAHLDYQQGRLVRSWTHLERQRGGFGFLGGPGETQIEADRRMIRDRMAHIRRNLGAVRRTRALHRQRRQRAPWPVVALVGYTNSGKSTLFNHLSHSDVTAQDMLFATLDPTMRQIEVVGLGKVILSDTVGFVSDLPTQLVAAFRATLEEVRSADLLLHVRDISHEDSEAQKGDVLRVLGELGIGPNAQIGERDIDGVGQSAPHIIEIWNKIDKLSDDGRQTVTAQALRHGAMTMSAVTGEGVDQIATSLSKYLGGEKVERRICLDMDQGRVRAWLHENANVMEERMRDDGRLEVLVRLSALGNGRLSTMLQS
ncbi:MAG: GTPase HflX [Sphingopyxis sp.]